MEEDSTPRKKLFRNYTKHNTAIMDIDIRASSNKKSTELPSSYVNVFSNEEIKSDEET